MPFDGIPVVYDGGDGVAIVASVSERTGLPVDQLAAVPLDTLLGASSQTIGDAAMRRCAREPAQMATVEAELGRATAAFTARDKAAAMDHLDLALALMGCLSEVVDARPAAQGFLLRATLLAESGDEEGARGEIRTALALDPEATWPGRGALDGDALLAEERAVPTSAALGVVPRSTGIGPWIDGHPVPADSAAVPLSPGLHLAQHQSPTGLQTAWVVVGGDATLVVPQSFRRPILERMADPATRPEVEALLAAALPGTEAAYVSVGDGLWLVTTDVEGVLTIELAKPSAAAEPEPAKGRKGKDKRR